MNLEFVYDSFGETNSSELQATYLGQALRIEIIFGPQGVSGAANRCSRFAILGRVMASGGASDVVFPWAKCKMQDPSSKHLDEPGQARRGSIVFSSVPERMEA